MDNPYSTRPECTVCWGVPLDHGNHKWRLDKFGDTVVRRCEICRASQLISSKDEFRRAVDGGYAHVISAVTSRLDVRPIVPCDVCGGTGLAASRTDARTQNPNTCPRCGRDDRVVRVFYGNFAPPETDYQKYGDLLLAGCLESDISPNRYCGRCDVEFTSGNQS